ncbi:hypothetical protein CDCA_CDCA06G1797 [Cyanidium caldarium]|uniref:Cytochrome c oxidase copper chaperone n=1 Tax=Cyanidium caldarium TaxID=2771 RepID=A0AAV9ITW3_CYACA|nr:hypothetical protein CDCA_CDCA06G1797 [Cyanidium caldarium]
MGNRSTVAASATESRVAQPATPAPAAGPPDSAAPKKKMCCACPETKRARDECVALRGEEACRELIEAHKACLRAEGFSVQ